MHKACQFDRLTANIARLAPRAWRAAFAASVALASCVLPAAARAAGPEPPWKFDDSPQRAVFALPPGQTHVMAHLPATLPKGGIVGSVRAATANGDRQVRILAKSEDAVDVLVDCTGLAPRTPVALYLAPGDQAQLAPNSPFVDPFPVRVEIRRAGGHDIPPSYESLRFLADRQLAPPFLMTLPAFAPVESAPPNAWYQGGWERPTYVATLSSWLVVPEAGEYRFALGDHAASFMAVDGRQCVARPPRWRNPDPWTEGEPLRLSAGLHRIEILTVCEKAIRVKAGWITPGKTEIEPIPAAMLACGGNAPALRLETRDGNLHAAFVGRPGPAYVFRGVPTVFSPVRLESLHVSWSDEEGPATCEWTSGGRALGVGQSILAIGSSQGDMPVKLRVTMPSGAESVAEGTVKLPRGAAREYLVSGRLYGVPAVCYDDDPVRPELHVRSTASVGVELVATVTATAPSGEKREFSSPVNLVRTWGRLEIPPCFARDIDSLDWKITHAGADLVTGRMVFRRAPFDSAPAALDGDRFVGTDGATEVFVAPRASAGAARALPRDATAVTFLDGFFRDESFPTNDMLRVRFADLPSSADDMRFTRLAALADIETLRGAQVVAIAPDLSGLAASETPADFERRLAALSEFAADALGASVILVTPPAGMVRMPANAGGPDPDRLVAGIVMRVADATGASVADAYTLSRTSDLSPIGAVSEAIQDALSGAGSW